MNKKTYLLFGFLGLVVLGAIAWQFVPKELDGSKTSLVVFNVENLTCGSCVKNIQKALSGVDGVGDVEVSVTSGSSRVEFDQEQITSDEIARVISDAGYPATVRERLSVSDYRALKEENGRLGNIYIARIGSRFLSRQEFDGVLHQRQAQLKENVTNDTLSRLRLDVWNELSQRELLLGSAEEAGVVVQAGEVDLELEKLVTSHSGMEQMLEDRFGSLKDFRHKLKNDLIIRRHLDLNVASPQLPESKRRVALQKWYQQLVDKTEVVIFDPAIKASLSTGSSGCGGSCCG